jgi:hypothetical protein
MLVDTIVSAVVPGADLEIRSNDGDLLASAPTVSTRRVQTYARIRNNTPFIIGGLVNRQDTLQQDKVPILGDLPIIGAAFRAERHSTEKREVIIVLTPYVLPEDQFIERALPRDDERFDSIGNELFRDTYRVRNGDVFDLQFLFDNERLKTYRSLAKTAIGRNFRLAQDEAFRPFVGEQIPGEDILVTRMVYDVSKRLEAEKQVDLRRVIFFEGKSAGGYDVRFIDRTLAQLAGGLQPTSFFRNQRGKALALTFTFAGDDPGDGRLASEPIPQLSIVECPDRPTWERLLLEMNQPDERGRERQTILIQDESDLMRLRRALYVQRIINLNGGRERMRLATFRVGKVLMLPDLESDQVHVVDADVARIFFHTEHYYAAAINLIKAGLRDLDEALRRPDVRVLLGGKTPGPAPATLQADE